MSFDWGPIMSAGTSMVILRNRRKLFLAEKATFEIEIRTNRLFVFSNSLGVTLIRHCLLLFVGPVHRKSGWPYRFGLTHSPPSLAFCNLYFTFVRLSWDTVCCLHEIFFRLWLTLSFLTSWETFVLDALATHLLASIFYVSHVVCGVSLCVWERRETR